MKKIMILFISLFVLSLNCKIYANETYIYDEYDQFSDQEESYYNQLASDFEQQYDMEVILLNLETTNVDPSEEAQNVYLQHCENNNVLILAYSDDYYVLQPYGSAISIVDDDLWNAYYQNDLSKEECFDAYFQALEDKMMEEPVVEEGLLFVDDAHLFDEQAKAELLQLMEKTSNQLGVDVVAATTNDMNEVDAEHYAREYYRDHNYQEDGIILMIDMEDRQWGLVSMGSMRNIFISDVRDDMSNLFVPYLSDGQYQEAFEKYVEEVISYYQLYQENGSNYQDALDDIEYEENKGSYFLMGSGIGLIVGLIVAFIVRSILVKQCKMVKMQTQAKDYLVRNSLSMRKSQDYFLYQNIVRTPRPKDDDRHSSSSSSHDSGGSSGRF